MIFALSGRKHALEPASGGGLYTMKIRTIFMPYDPFGRDRMVYTIRNMCEEDPTVPYDNGVRSLFLYTNGKTGITEQDEALQQLLKYMEETNDQNAVNEDLKELQNMVEKVKDDREVSLEFMKSYEREKYIFEQGVKDERKRSEDAIKNAAKRADDATKRADEAIKKAEERTEQVKRSVRQFASLNMSVEQIAAIIGEREEVITNWLSDRK
jgi:hypothetical protein